MSYKKYYIYKEQISYDNGVTWQDTGNETPSGDSIYKYDTLEECESGGQYRWVNMDASVDYYCVGTTKYYKQKRQVSFDDGQTWQDVTPPRYQRGGVAEEQSTDCGYVPPTGDKLVKTYGLSECERHVVGCDGNPNLNHTEVQLGCRYEYMETAVIGNCVTHISEEAFYQIPIRSVTIPDSVQWIGRIAFGYCTSLTSVVIPNSVTFIGEGAFAHCSNLRSINIPDGVTSLKATFYQDYALSRVNSDVDGVCNIPDSVETIGDQTFYWCSGLTAVNIPNSVTSIGSSAFVDCNALTSINIPDSVTSIGDSAFWRCTGLSSLIIGSGITTIGGNAFAACTSLTSIACLATTPPILVGGGVFDAFNDCPIYVPCESVSAYKSATNWSNYGDRIQPTQPCSGGIYRWVSLDPSVDYYCEGTTKYYKQKQQASYDGGQTWQDVFPAEYQKGGVAEEQSTDCGYVPSEKLIANYSDGKVLNVWCNSSTELTSGETQPSGYKASAMTEAVIGNCVTTIGNSAFDSCNFLADMTIPDSVTYIGNNAFGGTLWWKTYSADTSHQYNNIIYINDIAYKTKSNNITSVTFKSGTVSIGGGAFTDCTRLTSVTIPDSVISIGDDAFNYCTALTSVTIPDSVTYIGDSAFYRCNGLTSVIIPDSVTNIGGSAFWWCRNLASVSIGSGVTSIGGGAFSRCYALTSVTIPDSVTSIGGGAFNGCSGLTSIIVEPVTPPTMEGNEFNNTGNAPIYVPAQSLDTYKSAPVWSDYASRIQPIP